MDSKLPSSVKYIYAYIRRSRQDIQREKKTDQDTLAEQRSLLESILNKHYNHYDWDIYEEVGSGADAISDRPVFSHILKEIEKAPPRTYAIMVKEISRLGRGSYEQMGFIEKIILTKCVYIITPAQIYDPLDDNDIEYIRFHMFFANLEYGKITRRMREARYTYAAQGRWMTGGGGIPYGYKFNSYTQRLEPDENTAWVVQKIFDLYVNEGLGYNAISTRLTNEGIPTPTEKTNYWMPIVVRRILRNEVYIGTVKFRKTIIRNNEKIKLDEKDWIVAENAHPPLVSKEIFERAAEIMEENKSSPKVRLDFEPQPLAGLIVCSSCGKKMQRQYSTQHYMKKDGTESVYHKEFMNCLGCRVYIKYRAIEQEILRILQEDFIEVDVNILKQKLEEFIDLEKMQHGSLETSDRISVIQKQLESLEGELTALRRMLRKGQITDEEYAADRAEILKQKEEKERQLYFLQTETHREQIKEIDVEALQEGFKNLYDLYVNGDLSKGEKNEILRGIFDYIILEKTGKGKFNLHAYINPKIILNTISSTSH
ncbi:recombinase family protein [Bacillus alveayuensis]|jgi:site-specific DNA recombinase|uniref:recombinase family protein n=1 Tax=Aeribacillus alveayuensis TaxID=279215 RepID=UPI0005CD3866|nr:recombinase family protein [Bacillus alveayuensis]